MNVSRFIHTAATQSMKCPKCGAAKNESCVTPSKRKKFKPHGERTTAYIKSISREEFNKRHTISASNVVGTFF